MSLNQLTREASLATRDEARLASPIARSGGYCIFRRHHTPLSEGWRHGIYFMPTNGKRWVSKTSSLHNYLHTMFEFLRQLLSTYTLRSEVLEILLHYRSMSSVSLLASLALPPPWSGGCMLRRKRTTGFGNIAQLRLIHVRCASGRGHQDSSHGEELDCRVA